MEKAMDQMNQMMSGGSYIARHFRGELSLVKSFWINLVLINVAFRLGSNAVFNSMDSLSALAIVATILILLGVALAAWQLVGVWRSATNYQAAGKPAVWAILSKIVVGLGVLAQLYNLYQLISVYSLL